MLLIGLKLQLCVQVADIMQRNGNVSIKTVFKKCQDENPVIVSFIIWFKVPQMKRNRHSLHHWVSSFSPHDS